MTPTNCARRGIPYAARSGSAFARATMRSRINGAMRSASHDSRCTLRPRGRDVTLKRGTVERTARLKDDDLEREVVGVAGDLRRGNRIRLEP